MMERDCMGRCAVDGIMEGITLAVQFVPTDEQAAR
jgi:hypothetical protein